MNSINLLPPDRKNKLKENQIIFHFKNISYLLFALILVTFAMFYATKYYLNIKQEDIQKQIEQTKLTLPDGQSLSYDKIVDDIKSKMTFLSGLQNDYIKWSSFLIDFYKLVPNNVEITQLTLVQSSGDMAVAGHARFRDDFLQYKSNLDKSSLLSGLESPISNLVKNEDVDFTLSAKMTLDQFKIK